MPVISIPRESTDYGGDETMRISHGLKPSSHQGYWQNFNRYDLVYPQYEMDNYITRVFFTRPDCNIFTPNDARTLNEYTRYNAKMRYMNQFHNTVLQGLTSAFAPSHDFIPFLTNRVNSIQLQDYSIKTYNFTQMYTGYKTVYTGNAVESNSGGSLSITFRDDKWRRLTKFFDTWIEYMSELNLGRFSPKKQYIQENRFDYHCSIYTMTTDADDSDIVHFAKYTGVVPVNAPHSSMSPSRNSSVDPNIDVTFEFSHFRAFDPIIMIDFNKNSRSYDGPVTRYDSTDPSSVIETGAPYVEFWNTQVACGYRFNWSSKKV